jgi:hypothetical protein
MNAGRELKESGNIHITSFDSLGANTVRPNDSLNPNGSLNSNSYNFTNSQGLNVTTNNPSPNPSRLYP